MEYINDRFMHSCIFNNFQQLIKSVTSYFSNLFLNLLPLLFVYHNTPIMHNSNDSEIIDLTNSIERYRPRHSGRNYPVIEYIDLDDSLDDKRNKFIPTIIINAKEQEDSTTKTESKKTLRDQKSKNMGRCSICWEELGKKPLGSTKCGHVFCLTCLEKCLKINKTCPTCRRTLHGATAYHPLYLELM